MAQWQRDGLLVNRSNDRSCNRGMIHYTIYLISPDCPRPSLVLMQNRSLKHQIHEIQRRTISCFQLQQFFDDTYPGNFISADNFVFRYSIIHSFIHTHNSSHLTIPEGGLDEWSLLGIEPPNLQSHVDLAPVLTMLPAPRTVTAYCYYHYYTTSTNNISSTTLLLLLPPTSSPSTSPLPEASVVQQQCAGLLANRSIHRSCARGMIHNKFISFARVVSGPVQP